MTLAAAAAEYLTAGLSIIALSGKQPNTAIHRHGLNQALRGRPEGVDDEALLDQVFTHPDTTGVGIVIPEHTVVVDIDGEEGARTWLDLVGEDLLIPTTPVAATARGLHIWYYSPTPWHSTILGPKLDLKGSGGYVAAPPSVHPDGPVYNWLVPLVVDGMIRGIDYLPDVVEERLKARARLDDYDVPHSTAAEGGTLDGLSRFLASAEEGNRNHAAYWAACAARDDGFTLQQALKDLVPAAVKAGLPAFEAKRTVRSAYERRRG